MGSQNGSNSRQVDGDLESQRLASARRGDGFEPLSVEAVTFQAPKISRRGRTYVIFLAVVAVSSITAAALVLTLHFGWASEAGSAGTIVPDPFLLTDWQRRPRSVTARGGAVAADAGACSAAGALVLEEGGSAVDAAVAATFCQGVVNPMASGIGGGCFLLIREPEGPAEVIVAREVAPRSAHKHMYKEDPESQKRGAASVAVPLEVKGLRLAWERHGKLDWNRLLEPAVKFAEEGFDAHPWFVLSALSSFDDLSADPLLAEAFLVKDKGGWRVPRIGERCCRRPALAATLRAIAEEGVAGMYAADKVASMVTELNDAGGTFLEEDFHEAEPDIAEPLQADVWGMTVLGVPPPSSGGAAVIAALKFLAGYPEPWPASGLVGAHRLAEAMKHVFAMRSHLGDPGYRGRAFEYSPTDEVAEVVRAMLSDDYIAGLQSATNDGGTMDIESYGGEWGLDRHVTDDSGTTGLIAVDKSGAVAAVTSTINTSFGSKLISKSTGILFNNEMFDFSTPDSVSAFDLHPHEENFIEPFKRPLSSMAPTLVLMNDWPRVAASASGGPRIITSVLQTLLRHLSQGTPLLLAAAGPRMHHQLRPDILEAESSSLLDRLAQSGVDLSSVGHWGLPEGAVSARVLGARYDEIAATSGLSDGPACDGCPRDAASGAGVLPGGSVGSLRVPDETGTFLSGLGHVVEWRERFAVCQAVSIEQDGSGILITAVSDPRKDGAPASAEHRGR